MEVIKCDARFFQQDILPNRPTYYNNDPMLLITSGCVDANFVLNITKKGYFLPFHSITSHKVKSVLQNINQPENQICIPIIIAIYFTTFNLYKVSNPIRFKLFLESQKLIHIKSMSYFAPFIQNLSSFFPLLFGVHS